MPTPKYNFDTGEWDLENNDLESQQGAPAPANHDLSGLGTSPDFNGQTGAPPPADAGNVDRGAFQKDWMGSTGTFDDFIKSHPQYQGQVTPHNGSKDVYDLKGTNETLDLVGDVGGANKHNWTGTGVGQNGQVDQGGPASNPAFGSVNDFMSANGFGTSSKGSGFGDLSGLTDALKGLFPGGAYNQGIVDARTNLASDDLNRNMKSRMATNRAQLAERGTLGSGPEVTAGNRANEDLFNTYANAVRGIQADESQNADSRMIAALQTAAGMTAEQARSIIDEFRANTERTLGQGQLDLGNKNSSNAYSLGLGNLALGNMNGVNDYNLGLGNFGLNRDKLLLDQGNLSQSEIDKILGEYLNGSTATQSGRR